MKKILQRLLLGDHNLNNRKGISLTSEMQSLMQEQGSLSIVQVGANDGKLGDPIYDFVLGNARRTRVLLIEPQANLIPFIEANYANHPSHKIINIAIGQPGELTLYSIHPNLWQDVWRAVKKPDWPLYRAATGVTSSDRQHVERWLKRKLGITQPTDRDIVKNKVRCLNLDAAIKESRFPAQIDVLQIDVEGMDDHVIYHSTAGSVKPKIIHFEHQHLSILRRWKLKKSLNTQGYRLTSFKKDTIAILETGKF